MSVNPPFAAVVRQLWPKGQSGEQTERAPRRRASIRQLKAGEAVPTSEPKRYRNQKGYIRLRWLVAPQTYWEVYEHRVVDGVVTTAQEVHHRNGDKADNRSENLQPLSKVEHARHHGSEKTSSFGRYRTRARMERAQRAAAKAAKRERLTQEMRALYEAGASTVEIANRYGTDAGGVSRRLRQAGTRMRQAGSKSNPKKATRSAVQSRAAMSCERCAQNLTWIRGEIHHLKNRSQGGGNELTNLVLLCIECHGWVTQHPHAAHEEGYTLWHGEAPGSRPILSQLHGPVWLLADGRTAPAVWPPCRRCGRPLAPGYRCGVGGDGPYHMVCADAIEGGDDA